MAAIGLNARERQCLGRRLGDRGSYERKGAAWVEARNAAKAAPADIGRSDDRTEFEAMPRVNIADSATIANLLHLLRHLRQHAEQWQPYGRGRTREYSETGGPIPKTAAPDRPHLPVRLRRPPDGRRPDRLDETRSRRLARTRPGRFPRSRATRLRPGRRRDRRQRAPHHAAAARQRRATPGAASAAPPSGGGLA